MTRALHPDLHALRPFRGAIACAANLRRLLAGSGWVDSLPEKVQDAYSLRCTPQVYGAVRDGVRYARDQIRIELNAATDNPLVLVDEEDEQKAFSGGMFHGEPVGLAADHLKLALCELGSLSERRTYRLTTGTLSGRLPPALARADKPEIGLLVPQTTAAALVSENRSLAWPASADSIPTCEDQEDHVAMSTTAARRALRVLENARGVIAVELLAAAHGLWERRRAEPDVPLARGTEAALDVLTRALGGPYAGACPSEAIACFAEIQASGVLRRAVEDAVGPLAGVDDA